VKSVSDKVFLFCRYCLVRYIICHIVLVNNTAQRVLISILLVILSSYLSLFVFYIVLLQIVALREQNAHIQRKVASGDGAEDLLEGTDAQKVHGKVGTYSKLPQSAAFSI